ncbi:MAG: protein kinase [Ignavibacteriaceae bacterium]|nr:protein kinase [Ignavibacteriaceae bacterium]
MPGTREIMFEKFEILECLKKDEHSGVYLANHIYLGKKIILKSLNTKTAADEEKIERFKREAKILAQLDHPNIIKVLDFGTYNEYFYISFEYFESLSLRHIIKHNNLTLTQKEFLLTQLFKGLAFAHQHQIIHRDIKPENILVDDKFNLKLSDFGLALVMNDNFISGQFSLVGTPCYMSPEQVEGEQLTEKTDLFSAGIVLFELFKGYNPLLGADINESFNKVLAYNENKIFEELGDLPDGYRLILETLLKKNPFERFSTAKSVLDLLSLPEHDIVAEEEELIPKRKINPVIYIALVVILSAIMLFLVLTEKKIEKTSDKTTNDSSEVIDKPALVSDSSIKNAPVKENILVPVGSKEPVPINRYQQTDKNISAEKPIDGKLHIECLPWANVFINSRHVETTPISKDIVLPAGKYSLRLAHPDYPEYNGEVLIKAGETTSLSFNLETLFGYIDCKVYPWGEVFLNGIKKGSTPLQAPIKTRPGDYLLIVKNPNYKTKTKNVSVKQGETLLVKIDLTKE